MSDEMERDEWGALLCDWDACLSPAKPEEISADRLSLRAGPLLAAATVRAMSGAFHGLGQFVQSPPEKAFLAAFIIEAARSWSVPTTHVVTCPGHQPLAEWGAPDYLVNLGGSGAYVVCPQHHVDKYRVDFFIWTPANGDNSVAVEIDGHDFHEKTRHQVARDKRRERAIVAAGLKVLRFSGSEIFKDASACAKEALAILDSREPKR